MEAFAPGMGTPIPYGVSGERSGDGARAGAQGRKALLVIVIVIVAQIVVFILEVIVIQINGLVGIVPTLAHGCSFLVAAGMTRIAASSERYSLYVRACGSTFSVRRRTYGHRP